MSHGAAGMYAFAATLHHDSLRLLRLDQSAAARSQAFRQPILWGLAFPVSL